MGTLVLKQYVVDAFTSTVFRGNPAAVCVLEEWIPDNLMQNIAKENNLSETAFTVKNGDIYDLRWFTPEAKLIYAAMLLWGQLLYCFDSWKKTGTAFLFRRKAGC